MSESRSWIDRTLSRLCFNDSGSSYQRLANKNSNPKDDDSPRPPTRGKAKQFGLPEEVPPTLNWDSGKYTSNSRFRSRSDLHLEVDGVCEKETSAVVLKQEELSGHRPTRNSSYKNEKKR